MGTFYEVRRACRTLCIVLFFRINSYEPLVGITVFLYTSWGLIEPPTDIQIRFLRHDTFFDNS